MKNVALVMAMVLPATQAAATEWEWTIAPYFWGADTSLDISADDEPVLGGDLSLSDLLDKTEIAGMLHFEGSRGKAGFFVDLLFLSLADERTTAANPPLPGGTLISTDLELGLYEAAGFYRVLSGDHVLDVFLGTRVVDLDQESDITFPAPIATTTTADAADTFLDALVGARYGLAFARRWDFVLRGDVSTGDTELTWNALGTFGVYFGKTDRYGLRFGWREMEIEVEDESDGGVEVTSELGLSGPIGAFTFRF
jgi:hypothetical protein